MPTSKNVYLDSASFHGSPDYIFFLISFPRDITHCWQSRVNNADKKVEFLKVNTTHNKVTKLIMISTATHTICRILRTTAKE
jgi:hypothetical protein